MLKDVVYGLTGPAVALVGSYELLMMIIRAAQPPGADTAMDGAPECTPNTDPVQVQAAQTFAVELAAGRVPSVRAIRARLHVGQPRSQRVRVPGHAQRRVGGRVPRTSGCDL